MARGQEGKETLHRALAAQVRIQAWSQRSHRTFHGGLERASLSPRPPISKVGTVAPTLVIMVNSIPKSDATLLWATTLMGLGTLCVKAPRPKRQYSK